MTKLEYEPTQPPPGKSAAEAFAWSVAYVVGIIALASALWAGAFLVRWLPT